ncbi:MAG: GNAT family N-acetyltransferase [Myxococcales bacterium]|nr:GNAT family N-acetyltransferase [Myxococcales bacterium]
MPARRTTIVRVDADAVPLEACARLIADAYGPWAALVALEKLTGESPHGPSSIWIAHGARGEVHGVAVGCGAYLRVLAVGAAWRRQGLGSRLLQAVEAGCGAAALHVHAEPGNYLLPGIDASDTVARAWLIHRGYRPGASCLNMRVPLQGAGAPSAAALAHAIAAIARHGVTISSADAAQRAAALPIIRGEFSHAWAHECARAKALWLARTTAGDIVGFAATGGNNAALNWFGPTGTLPAHRGRGIATALLLAAVRKLAAMQAYTVIPWTNADRFYIHACGAQVERRFVAMSKTM